MQHDFDNGKVCVHQQANNGGSHDNQNGTQQVDKFFHTSMDETTPCVHPPPRCDKGLESLLTGHAEAQPFGPRKRKEAPFFVFAIGSIVGGVTGIYAQVIGVAFSCIFGRCHFPYQRLDFSVAGSHCDRGSADVFDLVLVVDLTRSLTCTRDIRVQ